MNGDGHRDQTNSPHDELSDEASLDYGLLEESAGRLSTAEAWYRRAVSRGDREGLVALGRVLCGLGRTREAEQVYQQAVDRGVNAALLPYGNLLADLGRTEEAEAVYRRAIEMIAEVKNVATLRGKRVASQLEDYLKLAEKDGGKLVIFVRKNTRISARLKRWLANNRRSVEVKPEIPGPGEAPEDPMIP